MKYAFAKLICDDGSNGSVRFSDRFMQEDPLFRADVLRDVLFDIENEYNKTVPLIIKKAPGVSPEG